MFHAQIRSSLGLREPRGEDVFLLSVLRQLRQWPRARPLPPPLCPPHRASSVGELSESGGRPVAAAALAVGSRTAGEGVSLGVGEDEGRRVGSAAGSTGDHWGAQGLQPPRAIGSHPQGATMQGLLVCCIEGTRQVHWAQSGRSPEPLGLDDTGNMKSSKGSAFSPCCRHS